MEITLSKKATIIFVVLISIVSLLLIIGLFIFALNKTSSNNPFDMASCLPAFYDGDGPYYKSNSPFRDKIVPDDTTGEKLIIEGKILNTNCTKAVGTLVMDIWQADNTGEYRDDNYRGQINIDREGNYKFETIVPKGYGEGTGYRPPHIHFKIWEGNKLIVTSEMFFPDSKGKPGFEDEYILNLEERNGSKYAKHNIVLPNYP